MRNRAVGPTPGRGRTSYILCRLGIYSAINCLYGPLFGGGSGNYCQGTGHSGNSDDN